MQPPLSMCRLEEVGASHHVSVTGYGIVDSSGKLVGEKAIAPPDNEISRYVVFHNRLKTEKAILKAAHVADLHSDPEAVWRLSVYRDFLTILTTRPQRTEMGASA